MLPDRVHVRAFSEGHVCKSAGRRRGDSTHLQYVNDMPLRKITYCNLEEVGITKDQLVGLFTL